MIADGPRAGDPPSSVLSGLGLSAPVPLARTERARLWRVIAPGGGPAVLKLYADQGPGDEAPGLALLEHWDGAGAVRVLARSGPAVLLEFLPGPPLGDLVRAGRDDRATGILAGVAARLHAAGRVGTPDLPGLDSWFQPLFTLRRTPDSPADGWRDMQRAAALARDLLASHPAAVVLHGDLHHDNILQAPRGWCAIDPKGILGDPAYDFANAFRNPVGASALMRDPERIRAMARRIAGCTGQDRRRLLRWGAAHCALSIAWSCGTDFAPSDDLDLLHRLLAIAGAEPD